MSELLSDDYIATVVRDARRFQGQWCGTSGNLAAHCMRTVKERGKLLEIIGRLESENAAMRASVSSDDKSAVNSQPAVDLEAAWNAHKAKCAATAMACKEASDKPLAESGRCYAGQANVRSPAEQLCERTAEVIRDRRPKYGGPRDHFARTIGMVNAAFRDVLVRPLTEADWATIMILDKIARFRGPNSTDDGPVDIAGYAACMYEVTRETA